MNVDAQPPVSADIETRSIDPYGFWPAYISRIGGLGGDEPGPDETYALHTSYEYYGNGWVIFSVRFDGMRAKLGTLSLFVNALPTAPGALAYTAAASETWLPGILDGKEINLVVQSAPDTLYALLGYIRDRTDVTARALEVTVRREADLNDYTSRLIEARRTTFGAPSIRPTGHLISNAPATLEHPTSQLCTSSQFDEPAYAEWMKRLRLEDRRRRKHWDFVYILQSLERYGMLKAGAHGLGFGVGTEPLPALMASIGCSIMATDLPIEDEGASDRCEIDQHGAQLEKLRRPDICPDPVFDENVTFRAVDMAEIPTTLQDFDFTWSSGAFEHHGSIAAGLRFVANSIACLKPGGIAIHTIELALGSSDVTADDDMAVPFRRQDCERLALNLISQGHEVAQFKYDPGKAPLDAKVDMPSFGGHDPKLASENPNMTSFGIIVRRGLKT